MPTREQITALGNTVTGLFACFANVAAATPATSAAYERGAAAIAATSDPVEQIVVLVGMARDIASSGVIVASDWMAAGRAASALPAASISPAITRSLGFARCGSAFVEAACWQEAAIAAVTTPPRIRDDAQALRTAIVDGVEPVLDRVVAYCGEDAYHALRATVDAALEGIDAAIVSIAPLVKIRTARRIPSSVAAWILYDDPSRAGELVERSGTATPMIMPLEFLAAAPGDYSA